MFEKFLNKIDKLDEDENKKKEPDSINWVGIILEGLSILIVVGGILASLIMMVVVDDASSVGTLIGSSLLTALFIRALAEIINLLQKINDKL
jgi:uncharacterized membrane protein